MSDLVENILSVIPIVLLTALTQFTNGKTGQVLCELTKRYLLNVKEEYHLIDIVITNKSLAETGQWKCRTEKKFKNFDNITIDILSSKSNNYTSIAHYIVNIMNCETSRADLPNILIMCYHSKRIQDLIELIKSCRRPLYIKNKDGKELYVKLHISFDEVDVNLGVTSQFFKDIKPYINEKIIIGILFITATPVKEFWKMLQNQGIMTLLNINHDKPNTFEEDFINYRSFEEHNIIEYENNTKNPLYYIIDVFANKIIDESVRKIIFAPGHIYTEKENVGSHKEIVDYFNDRGYCVFLMNGLFKGFVYPDKSSIELSEFNIKNNIHGELRETLIKWNELNPTMNLAITGYCVIERGITFNTTGFNFTDAIFSKYILSCENRAVQILGRVTGGKEFVKRMNIICTKAVKETILSFNENIKRICELNPTEFNRTDFIDTSNTIPIKMIFLDRELLDLVLKIRDESKRGYKEQLHVLLLKGIEEEKISIIDKNNVKKLDITKRVLNQVRMYKLGDKIEVRRFKQFNESFETYKCVSQSGDKNQYNIDLVKDKYILDDFENDSTVAWITYKF